MQYLCKKNIEMDKIIGLGNALVDVLATLKDDTLLDEMGLPKGSMQLIDDIKLQQINEKFANMKTHLATGGSAGNTILGLSCLGAATGFIGKVGNDDYGKFFRENLQKNNIEDKILLSDLPSGVASTFISPGGERTFGTYLGAASTLRAEDLSLDMFKGYAYLYIEGYLVQDHDMILRAIKLAKEAGLQICLDMASYNIVENDKPGCPLPFSADRRQTLSASLPESPAHCLQPSLVSFVCSSILPPYHARLLIALKYAVTLHFRTGVIKPVDSKMFR